MPAQPGNGWTDLDEEASTVGVEVPALSSDARQSRGLDDGRRSGQEGEDPHKRE